MRIEELIIDGFKSYATRTVITGWDASFNAITGLNGSGKSNILDAICFVLGIASMTVVRAQNLQDLIYKRGQAGVTKASVTIVFDNSVVSKSPIGFEGNSKISVTRQIALGGTSKYLINGHRAQQQTVLQLFQSVQLNINNPNFLIMQGKITKVLNMKPAEILSLIEEAAGTRMFEDRREKAVKTMAKKETKLHEIRSLLEEEIEPKLEKLRNEKRTFLDFQQTQADLETMSRLVAAHDYHNYSVRLEAHGAAVAQMVATTERLTNENSLFEAQIAASKAELAVKRAEKEAVMGQTGALKDLEAADSELSKNLARLATSAELNAESHKEEAETLARTRTQLARLQNDATAAATLEALDGAYKKAKHTADSLREKHAQKEDLHSTLSTGVSSKGSADGGYAAHLQREKEVLNKAHVAIQQAQLKISHIQQQMTDDEPRLAKAQTDSAGLVTEIAEVDRKIQLVQAHLATLGFDPEQFKRLKERESALHAQLDKLHRERESQLRSTHNLEFLYTKPTPTFDAASVKGVAATLFTVDETHDQKLLALEACAGGKLYNVIVDNERVGSQLLERGNLKRRVTIIPLNKINPYTINPRAVASAKQMCPGKVELALDMVTYEPTLKRAMDYIFGGALVCEDSQTAQAVTFSPNVRAKSVTWQGDIYDPHGTVSGGSKRSQTSVLLSIRGLQRLKAKIAAVEDEVRVVQQQLAAESQLNDRTKSVQKELAMAVHQRALLQRQLESNPSSLILGRNQAQQQEVTALRLVVAKETALLERLKAAIERLEEEIRDFASDKGGNLRKLAKEIEVLAADLAEAQAKVTETKVALDTHQLGVEDVAAQLEDLKEVASASERALAELEHEAGTLQAQQETLAEQSARVKEQLAEEKGKLFSIDSELKLMSAHVVAMEKRFDENNLERKRLAHEADKAAAISAELKAYLDALQEEHPWVMEANVVEKEIAKNPNINLADCRHREGQLKERFQGMRRKVNENIMSMIDNVEKKETELKTMIKTIEKDKAKIEETIATLNEYKKKTLIKTWGKVSEDFGQIFGDLLPGSFAKLVVPEGMDVTEGLEVKIMLGKVWKESLVELSGGQRSLIALSLIMALLQFNPAPMYILDEVDAALDLTHTQNIGHLIKTRFKGSQFIVVSLKEGMFTNANRIFRTRFQDGTSVVSMM